jgi:hypothetical protein
MFHTALIAANDSSLENQQLADYVATGHNDQEVFIQVIEDLREGGIISFTEDVNELAFGD